MMALYEMLYPSMLITFREALEAALVVTIIVTYLRKVGSSRHAWYAYAGAGTALLVSMFTGYAVQTVYGGLAETPAQVFEGVASLTAVAVLTYMILWMSGHGGEIKGSLQTRMDVSLN